MIDEIKDHNKILEELYDSAKKEQDYAKKRLDEANRSYQFVEKFKIYYQKMWQIHLKNLMENEDESLNSLKDKNPSLENFFGKIYQESKKETESILKRFPAHFEKACKDSGLDIDTSSRHPRYRVCDSFIEVEILEKTEKAKISDREGTLEIITCDIGAIIESLQTHKERLFGREFDGKKFLSYIYKQYAEIIKKEKLNDGDPIPIRRITTRMGKNVKGFRTDEFLIDISRLVKENLLEIDGRKLDFQQTKDNKKGMLLHGLESRGYVGLITFKKEVSE